MPGYLGAAVAGAGGACVAAAAAVFVVEQNGQHQKFNRGLLLNAGVELAAAEGYNHFICHDVDMLPSEELRPWYLTAPEPGREAVTHVAWRCTNQSGFGNPYPAYLGGITALSAAQMRRVNGFPNNYWGWGGEDDELRRRCEAAGLQARPLLLCSHSHIYLV
jgi:hypothetical protein